MQISGSHLWKKGNVSSVRERRKSVESVGGWRNTAVTTRCKGSDGGCGKKTARERVPRGD